MHLLPTSLRYFQEVARTGSIAVAADTLHVSASAISRQVAALERQMGVALFERHARGMDLTAPGRLLLSHVRRTGKEGARLIEELRTLSTSRRQVLRVASCEGLARRRIPEALCLFQQEHPDVDIRLTVLPSAFATHRVQEGEADVAAVYAIAPPRDISVFASFPAPAHAVLPRKTGEGLYGEPIPLAALCEYPLALSSQGITQRELFDLAVGMEGLTPRIAMETDHVGVLMEFVRSGTGATLLSHFALDQETDDFATLRAIDHPVLGQRHAQVHLPPPGDRKTWAEAFAAHLATVLAAHPLKQGLG
ncbi:LysR family transcriptional regulator [Arthrobacter sp. NPDC090010]|uniref:LysR family transcriptional regulator n=1 Tax=Arthrobacter sp. NPDC090010 TaxID=3363942 RepID=UPI0038202237